MLHDGLQMLVIRDFAQFGLDRSRAEEHHFFQFLAGRTKTLRQLIAFAGSTVRKITPPMSKITALIIFSC